MKRINYILFSAALLVSASSCNDILDVDSTTQFNESAIWSDPDVADGYVVAAYNTIADHSNLRSNTRRFYDAYTDLYKSTSWDQYEHMYNKNLMETSKFGKNNAIDFGIWSEAYGRIKRTNILINSIESQGAKFGENWQKVRIAEARFCNAINYWFIARVYGGAVIRTPYSGVNGKTDDGKYEQDCNRARVSEAETYDYIIKEMKEAIVDLPDEWESKYVGRATKGMVYGFLSRIALYAHDWETAVEAADKCKELGKYELVANYADLFKLDKDAANRKEVIYALYGLKDITKFDFDNKMRPFGDGAVYNTSAASMGQIVPTSELADSYEFKDGTEFDWSTWNKVTDANGKRLEDPFTYREPRFQATILYNGATWEKRTIETYVGVNASVGDGADSFKEYVNAGSTAGHTCTGYYMRKYLMEGNSEWTTKQSWMTENILRYAEVLLNKAEALAELGRIDEALAPLNQVRARVGLPAKTVKDAPDKDSFMKILRKERICELAGEGLRYWDLRRWKIAHEVIDGQTVHGVKITRRASGSFAYAQVDCDGGNTRIFQQRYYYFSIPADELTNNKLCVDNPGW